MNIKTVLDILLFIGAAQGLLLSIALFSPRRGNATANRILAVLLLSFSLLIFFHTAGHYHTQPPTPGRHRWLIHGFMFCIAPLLFFYTRALTDSTFKIRWRESLHFLPSLAAMATALFLEDLMHVEESTPAVDRMFLGFMAVQMVVYVLRMLFILRDHTKNIQNTYSSLEQINLRWLRLFVISQTVIWPVAGFIDVQKHDSSEIGFVWLLVSIFMVITGYFGLRQPEIFSGALQEERRATQGEKKKYEKSALSSEQGERILQRLHSFMESSKPYLIPTLTLPELSKQMNVSPHHLSQILNEKLNNNFFEYINNFRVKEAKRLLKDPGSRHLTLAAIGFEAGFNSVSSFNSVFKKSTSFTPSEYQVSEEPASMNS